jgi:hypothetical protein
MFYSGHALSWCCGIMRVNMLSIVASILIFLSLALPWFSTTFDLNVGNILGLPIGTVHIGLSIYFFGFIGTTNGVPQVVTFPFAANSIIFTVLLIAGIITVLGSLISSGERRMWIMLLAGTLAIVCTPLFYLALVSALSTTSLPGTQGSGGGYFVPQNLLSGDVFGGFNVQTGPSFFWLPIVAGVLAIISIKIGSVGRSREESQYPEQYPEPSQYPYRR